MTISKQSEKDDKKSNEGGNGTGRRSSDSGYTKSGSSPGQSGNDEDGMRGRKKTQLRRNDESLEVRLIFVEVSDEEREERLNRIAGIMIDSALTELGITKKKLTRKEDKLQ